MAARSSLLSPSHLTLPCCMPTQPRVSRQNASPLSPQRFPPKAFPPFLPFLSACLPPSKMLFSFFFFTALRHSPAVFPLLRSPLKPFGLPPWLSPRPLLRNPPRWLQRPLLCYCLFPKAPCRSPGRSEIPGKRMNSLNVYVCFHKGPTGQCPEVSSGEVFTKSPSEGFAWHAVEILYCTVPSFTPRQSRLKILPVNFK